VRATADSDRLRIALLTYRGNPYCGGQGVYARQLSAALTRLGHEVEVISGPPYPVVAEGVRLRRLDSLQLYRDEQPFRPGRPLRDWIDAVEIATMSVGRYPEPLAFSLRARRELAGRAGEFDVVHDNQGLGYGMLGIARRLPVVATIHHPLSVDRELELERARGRRRGAVRRYYGFTRMQGRVARRLPKLLTVSESSRRDVARDLGVPEHRLAVVPLGVDPDVFRPVTGRRNGHLVMATASADVPLKGVAVLLEAMAGVRAQTGAELVVVGRPDAGGDTGRLVARLGLDGAVRFVGGLPEEELVDLYAQATLAVVPSLYEGFSLPAIEAMACGVPLVATSAGALPEVVGPAGVLVPPGDASALAAALLKLLGDEPRRRALGAGGRRRAVGEFSWKRTAERTADVYREAISC
jgi:MMP alpha-(1->4)-mannosyltransferase